MNGYIKTIEVRWSDLDPNFHLRHSVYYDYGAYSRICFLEEHGLGTAFMLQHHIGPILFREECVFRKEIKLGDAITIDLELLKAREDQSRWSMRHHVYKNGDVLAAIITVDGAWIDTQLRKLSAPKGPILEVFAHMPRATDFEWIK
jgi:acyl-CoA thioester hydrolase